MRKYFLGTLHWASYPYDDEEDSDKMRPVIIFDEATNEALVIKVTSHAERDEDDVIIKHWEFAGLPKASVARVSKIVIIPEEDMGDFIGTLHDEDLLDVSEKFYQIYGTES